ncbi:MAG: right-handed parallel beta-helix repeat-containing protein [Treponema sp.]|uniref:hypothetical protein n=1 Tax=Treponema sp. TaxID=166 RepID=UPI00298E69B3|nr:hypothetical protein [Treponema sp.]MCQ2600471.1 right-handed parallel beta-helix repeat-containing protein [Treponema sp.]
MKDFFEYYTDKAGVGIVEYPELSGVNISGVKCIGSEENKIISFFMRNPQKYDLAIGYEFSDPEVASFFQSGGFELGTYQSDDKLKGQVVFPQDFLNALEMGRVKDELTGKIHKDLSGKILLTDLASGRDFESFDVNFMVNSKPERVRGAMFQLDTNVVNDGTYIVCFNLKNLNSTVHQMDTHDLYIGNNHWKLDGSQRDLKITEVYKEDPELELTKTKPAVYNLDGTASSFEELSAEGYVPLYFKTNKKHASSTDVVTYNISIIDDDGLSVTSVVSNQADQLQAPTINVVDDSVNPAHELTEKFTLVINHERATWHKNEDGSVSPGALSSDYPYIKYKVTKGPQVVASGIKRGRVEVELASAKGYKVEAFSYLDGYVDSDDIDPATFAVSRSVNYYVSQIGQADATGSKNNPYGTFEECINEINNQITTFGPRTEYNIYVMTDLTKNGKFLDSYAPPSGKNYKLNIYGLSGTRKLTSTGDSVFKFNNGDIHIENLLLTGNGAISSQASSLYLKNVQVKDCTITSNSISAIQVLKGTFTLDGCTVSGNTITGESTYPAGIFAQTDVTLKGTNVIYGNEKISGGVSSPSNLFLANKSSGNLCLIKPDGPIGAETKIGVSAAVTPTAGHPVVISSGYGYKTSTSPQFNKKPGLYFKGDLNGVSALDDEICLAVSGVSSRPFVYEDDIQFQLFEGDSSTDYKFTIGNAASFNIKPLHDNDGTPYYFDTDELEDVTWDVYVTNHSSPTGVSSQTSQITIPDRAPFNIAPDKYELHINMTVPTYSKIHDCYITRTYSGMHIITGEKQQ